jgi:hypothetical protein
MIPYLILRVTAFDFASELIPVNIEHCLDDVRCVREDSRGDDASEVVRAQVRMLYVGRLATALEKSAAAAISPQAYTTAHRTRVRAHDEARLEPRSRLGSFRDSVPCP